jgi:uncharacterized protein
MKNLNTVEMVAFYLMVVGAINWGLVGLLGLNLVALILGTGILAKLVYILVGVSGVYALVFSMKK